MSNSRFYSSIAAATNLQVTAAPSDVSIQVASSLGWPNTFPFIVALDYGAANEELVLVTAGGPSVFTVTRAYDGTSASTHNAGAVVRHTSSAIDFTDSRTHEASTTGVHGVTGSFVDTLSTQTLSNKTLNAPVINGGTVTGTVTATGATVNNGTFSGSTLSAGTVSGGTMTGSIGGSPSFTGGPSFTTTQTTFSRTNTTDTSFRVKLTGDSNNRLQVNADGSLTFGSGSASGDAILSRTGAGVLNVTGDLTWDGVAWTAYTPTWTATTSNPAIGLGGTLQGYFKRYGKTCVVIVNIIAGTTSFFRGSGTYSISLPFQAANHGITTLGDFHILSTANGRWMGQNVISPGATTTSGFIAETTTVSSTDVATGKAVVWRHDTPFAFDQTDQARFTFVYETV